MSRNVIIIGASGHGSVIADIVCACGYNVLGFLDDDTNKNVLGPISDYSKYPDVEFIIGIGNAITREKISAIPVKWYTAIHPSAIVSPSAKIGEESAVMPNLVTNASAVVVKNISKKEHTLSFRPK